MGTEEDDEKVGNCRARSMPWKTISPILVPETTTVCMCGRKKTLIKVSKHKSSNNAITDVYGVWIMLFRDLWKTWSAKAAAAIGDTSARTYFSSTNLSSPFIKGFHCDGFISQIGQRQQCVSDYLNLLQTCRAQDHFQIKPWWGISAWRRVLSQLPVKERPKTCAGALVLLGFITEWQRTLFKNSQYAAEGVYIWCASDQP